MDAAPKVTSDVEAVEDTCKVTSLQHFLQLLVLKKCQIFSFCTDNNPHIAHLLVRIRLDPFKDRG